MADLEGQVALVTGASRGIGRAIAVAYASAGATVVLAARSRDGIDETATTIEAAGGRAVPVEMDVADAASVSAGFGAIADAVGRLDIAVLNAGVFPEPASVESSTAEQWRDCFAVNVFGVVETARATIPLMRPAGGRIVVLGSGTGHQAHPGLGAYGASKAAVASIVRILAVELRSESIAVNELIPGPVVTTLTGRQEPAATSLTNAEQEWVKTPEDVTDLALFLARCPPHGPTGQVFSLMGRLL